jgi:serine/threonine protein kinase
MIGKKLAHYRILDELGRGGMGVVYRARDEKLDRIVAVKFLASHLMSDDRARERFVREARAAAMLQHDSICAVHEVQETPEGDLFIVMPLYDGQVLKDIIQEGPLDPDRALGITRQIAEGLEAAASRGLVHRDIKPGNLFVTKNERVKILDFGLAKHAGATDLTASKGTVGTMAYMSPE